MIKVAVLLENEYSELRHIVEITKEELQQLACNKARDQFGSEVFHKFTANEVNIELNK